MTQILVPPPPIDDPTCGRESIVSKLIRTCEHNQLLLGDVHRFFTLAGLARNDSRQEGYLANAGGTVSDVLVRELESIVDTEAWSAGTLRDVRSLLVGCVVPTCEYRQWCPQCLAEDARSGRPLFDRLLWNIGLVKACPLHSTRLETRCGGCGADRMKHIYRRGLIGFCPRCTRTFLGSATGSHPASDYEIWTAKQFADLLAGDVAAERAAPCAFAQSVELLVELHCKSSYAAFAKAIGRNKSVVATWKSLKALPKWTAVCDISYAFSTSAASLVTFDKQTLAKSGAPRSLAGSPRVLTPPKRKKTATDGDFDVIRQLLGRVLEGHHPAMRHVVELEQLVRCDRKTQRVRFPAETHAIQQLLDGRRTYVKHRTALEREQRHQVAAYKLAREFRESGDRLTRREIDRRLAADLGYSPSFEELRELRLIVKSASTHDVADPPASSRTSGLGASTKLA
jgi:hypothetical protein